MKKTHQYLIAIATLVSLCLPLQHASAQYDLALNQYRCDGRIQYRPCDVEYPAQTKKFPTLQNTNRRLMQSALASNKQTLNNSGLFAEVVTSNFRKLTQPDGHHTDGQWRGRIRGNGDIHLTLQILRARVVESTRYMGHVSLANKETSFNFISSAPQGKDWSYRILALAK